MSLTAPENKGVVTDFTDATPSATVAFQAMSTPAALLINLKVSYKDAYKKRAPFVVNFDTPETQV